MSQLEVVENQFVLPVDITEAGTVTKTLNTAGTYVDKNIKLDITTPKAEYEVKSANSVTATVAMVDNAFASETETKYPITITADATAPEVKVGIKPGKAGFAAETDVVTVAKADAEQASKKIYIKEGALASSGTASAEGHGVVLGEKVNAAPTAGFYVKASAAGSASVETAGWVDPNNTKPVSASGDAFYPIAEATLVNEVAEGAQENYTEKDDAPILISGSGLYINEGYIKNTYIPLARLVPDEANVVAGKDGNSNLIYKTVSVYDKDGNVVLEFKGSKETQECIDLFCRLHNVERTKINILNIAEVQAKEQTSEDSLILTVEEDDQSDYERKILGIQHQVNLVGLSLDVDDGKIYIKHVPQPAWGIISSYAKNKPSETEKAYKVIVVQPELDFKMTEVNAWINSTDITNLSQLYLTLANK